nr:FliM/FliN family flagellar motor C-terminal domain-containing protein [Variovorax terrae]
MPELHGGDTAKESGAPLISPSTNPLYQVKAKLQVRVGEITLSVAELLALRENQVLSLNSGLDEPVDLLLENSVVARGQLVALDGHFALQIVELPVAMRLATQS